MLYEALRLISSFLLFGGNHADVAAVLSAFVELHHAVDEGVQGVILAHTHVLAGVVGRAALADDDVAGDALLTAKNLNT